MYEIWLKLQCIMPYIQLFSELSAFMWCHYSNHRGKYSAEDYNTKGHYPLLILAEVIKKKHQCSIAVLSLLKNSLVAINWLSETEKKPHCPLPLRLHVISQWLTLGQIKVKWCVLSLLWVECENLKASTRAFPSIPSASLKMQLDNSMLAKSQRWSSSSECTMFIRLSSASCWWTSSSVNFMQQFYGFPLIDHESLLFGK